MWPVNEAIATRWRRDTIAAASSRATRCPGPAWPFDTRMYRNPARASARAVVDDGVAHDSLAHADRARRPRTRSCRAGASGVSSDRPPRAPRDDPLADRLGEVAGGEVVDADGQVRPVLLERAHRRRSRACGPDRARRAPARRAPRRRRSSEPLRSPDRSARPPDLVQGSGAAPALPGPACALGRRKSVLARSSVLEDRPALDEEPRGRLPVGEGQDGEARPRAQPIQAAQVVVGDQAAQRQRHGERDRPARPGERARRATSRAPSRAGRRRCSRGGGSSRSRSPSARTRARASAGRDTGGR